MTETRASAQAYGQQITHMSQALLAHDLDGLMDHYDERLVFIDGASGDRLTKDGLREYMGELWATQPDFAVQLVASHTFGDDFVATLQASATMTSQSGQAVPVRWVIVAIYTFDPTTLKVVREVAFSDEEAYRQRLADLGVA